MENTTSINFLCDAKEESEENDDFAMSPVADQINFLREYLIDHPDKAIDLFSHFDRKYRASGVNSLATFLESVCVTCGFSGEIKFIAVDALLSFEEKLEIVEEPRPDIKRVANQGVKIRNKMRLERAIFCLWHTLDENVKGENNVSTVLMFDYITRLCTLSDDAHYKTECARLMQCLLSNKHLDAEYCLRLATKIKDIKLSSSTFLYFLGEPGNPTAMRILAAQALLSQQSSNMSNDVILAQVEIFARDEELDGFLRANAADVLLGYGDEKTQSDARKIIQEIGRETGFGLYSNTQNVHVESIEESIRASLDTICAWATTNKSKILDFESTVEKVRVRRNSNDQTQENVRDAETVFLRIKIGTRLYGTFTCQSLFCSICAWIWNQDDQTTLWKRFDEELGDMVNTCTTGLVSRLVNILSGFGGFQIQISFKEQIKSNFSGRLNAVVRALVKTASDGDHPFYIERRNEIAVIYISDVIGLHEKEENEEDIKTLQAAMANREFVWQRAAPTKKIKRLCRSDRVEEFVKKVPNLYKASREHFSSRILFEFSSAEPNRKCFHLFFGNAFSKISENLRKEFRDFVNHEDFEMCVREALSFYEGN